MSANCETLVLAHLLAIYTTAGESECWSTTFARASLHTGRLAKYVCSLLALFVSHGQ